MASSPSTSSDNNLQDSFNREVEVELLSSLASIREVATKMKLLNSLVDTNTLNIDTLTVDYDEHIVVWESFFGLDPQNPIYREGWVSAINRIVVLEDTVKQLDARLIALGG